MGLPYGGAVSNPAAPSLPALPSRPFPAAPSEPEALVAALHRNRVTFEWKCFGVDRAAMSRTLAPSSLTLAGLVKHMALVEDHYFTHQLLGHPYPDVWAPLAHNENWDFESAHHDTPEDLHTLWRQAVDRSELATRQTLDDSGLDQLAADSGGSDALSLRRILIDMVEEYARHTGHADLIRESIDGLVGEGRPAVE